MPPPFKEWWKGHIVLPLSVRPSSSASGVNNLRLSFCFFFQAGASVSYTDISSFSCFILFIILLLCLADLVKHFDHLDGDGEHVQCLFCLLVPLVGYVL